MEQNLKHIIDQLKEKALEKLTNDGFSLGGLVKIVGEFVGYRGGFIEIVVGFLDGV